jgi:hypothetical protein
VPKNIIELMLFLTKLTSKPIWDMYFPHVKTDQPRSGAADDIRCNTDVGNGCRIHVLIRFPVDLLKYILCKVKFKWQVQRVMHGCEYKKVNSHPILEDD